MSRYILSMDSSHWSLTCIQVLISRLPRKGPFVERRTVGGRMKKIHLQMILSIKAVSLFVECEL